MRTGYSAVIKPEQKTSAWGFWSFLALLLMFLGFTLIGKISYQSIFQDLMNFVSGDLKSVRSGNEETLISAILNILAIIVITIPISLMSGLLFNRGAKSYKIADLEKLMSLGAVVVFLTVFLEEVFARWLWLGVIAKIFPNTGWFYVCFLLGNGLWAFLMHRSNYADTKERTVLRFVPQFIGGIAFSYVFVRYGFWAALLCHYFYDAVLFATMKKIPVTAMAIVRMAVYGIIAVLLAVLIFINGKSLNDLGVWMSGNIAQIDSYGFLDYLFLLLFVEVLSDLVASILLLDRNQVDDSSLKNLG